MPASSKAQQKFMGLVYALQKGDVKPSDVSQDVRDAAKSMSKKDAKDFASTKHKGLPKKVKQEILNKLKEYANKMGTDHLGGDDYTKSKKGGLRDFDGYDNVDYNKDMPMDEGMMSAIDQIRKNSKSVRDFIKKVLSDNDFKDMKNDKEFIKYLGSIYEGQLPNNWMSGRVSDYHTSLRGKKKDYSGGTNFKKDDSGQPDLEEATKIDFNSKGYKEADKLVSKLRSSVFRKLNDDELEQFRAKIAREFDLKESVKEYASKQTLSYLPLDDEEVEKMNETMITLTQNIAKDIIPMNTWSRYASDGKKNAEFVKSLMKDLTQTLNRFYKNHNINVRLKEK